MNITELIEELTEIKDAHGDLDVTVWADHGQMNTDVHAVGMQWVDDEGETYAEEDVKDLEQDEIDTDNLKQVVEIAG